MSLKSKSKKLNRTTDDSIVTQEPTLSPDSKSNVSTMNTSQEHAGSENMQLDSPDSKPRAKGTISVSHSTAENDAQQEPEPSDAVRRL
jgi:hypothetical protein